jgi:DNA-binding MurR/RpiR family transcriptional regulator
MRVDNERAQDMSEKQALSTPETNRPQNYDVLHDIIAGGYDRLSRRLQQVAVYALANPNDIALETIAVIADRAHVPPSSLIRFAKAFGFDGFTEMQRLFRARLMDHAPSSRDDRIEPLSDYSDRLGRAAMPAAMLHDFAGAGIAALERLRHDALAENMEKAIDLLAAARVIHIAGQRRAFPVAAYLAYLMAELGPHATLLDGLGGMWEQQGRSVLPNDVLIAVSFRKYSPEVVALAERCHERGVPVIALTDNPLSPLARCARISFEVIETETHTFRPLSAPMCLALALAVSLQNRLGLQRVGH